jgi:protein-S-isoprenylcysteine O-methyltransferase Ste14
MRVVELVFVSGWGAFWLYWLATALWAKRGHISWAHQLRIRILMISMVAALLLLFRVGVFPQRYIGNTSWWLVGFGSAFFALGLALAVWARVHIGRNWGNPMTQKDDPELVTSGPYRLLRHPIYSGLLMAGAGTAMALSWLWLIAVVFAGTYFLYSAAVEEHYLVERFPDSYPAYRRSTKMFLPFLF